VKRGIGRLIFGFCYPFLGAMAAAMPGETAAASFSDVAASNLLNDPSHPINALLRDIDQGTIGINQGADKIWALCAKEGWVYEMVLNPRQVGVDPCNRDSAGCNVEEVSLLMADIAFMGWSWDLCAHAQCVEIIPGDTEVEEFNRRLAAGVNLAPVEPNSILFGSLACGHTNLGLRAIQARIASEHPLLSRDGKLCVEKVQEKDAEMAKAVETGIKWKILRWPVRRFFPKVLEHLTQAGNSHVQRPINEVQGLLALHRGAAAAAVPDWPAITKCVLRTLPAWTTDVDELIAFSVAKSGGVKGTYLHNFKAFHSQFVNAGSRRVLGSVFGALADLKQPYCAYAILQAAYSCPPSHVKRGVCEWITANTVDKQKKPEQAQAWDSAEAVLSQAHMILRN